MTEGILHFRRKPKKLTDDRITAARYQPGQPLDALTEVARLASRHAELAEVTMPSGTVLVVRWYSHRHDEPELEWGVIQAGEYLEYDHEYGLGRVDDDDLRHHYDPVEDQ